jgi:large subunit ribosomal protein L4
MPQLPVHNLQGEQVDTIDLSDQVFAAPINEALIHQLVVKMLADRRRGTHKTKTRGEVSGGGAKPWRQKGTGRARQGSRRSPLWRGGGTVFGPQPRDYSQAMPKRMRRAAMRSGLSSRVSEGAIMILDTFTFPTHKTREMVATLQHLGLTRKTLIVDTAFDQNAYLATRNIPYIELQRAANLNLLDVLSADKLVFTVAALRAVEERLSNGTR